MRKILKHVRPGRPDKDGVCEPHISWQAVWQDGKKAPRRYKSFDTKKEAERHLREHERQMEAGAPINPNKTLGRLADREDQAPDPQAKADPDDIVPEFKRSILLSHKKPSAARDIEEQLRRITRHFGGRRLRSITAADIEEFRDALLAQMREREATRLTLALTRAQRKAAWAQRHPSVDPGPYDQRVLAIQERQETVDRAGLRTVCKVITVLRRLFRWAQSRQYVGINACATVVKPPHLSRIQREDDEEAYSPQEAQALWQAADPGLARAALMTLLYGGLRIGELRALRWENFQSITGRLRVNKAADKAGRLTEPKTKTAKRTVPLPGFVVAELKRWRLACPPSKLDLMFPSSTGRVLDYFNFAGRCFKRAQRRAGLRALPLHNCRHTAASLWIAAGVDIVRVSKLLGHKDPAITLKVYTHDVEKLSEATSAEKLEAFLTRENDCATTARGALKVVNAA